VDENGISGGGQGHPFYVTVLQGVWWISMLWKEATFLWSSEHKNFHLVQCRSLSCGGWSEDVLPHQTQTSGRWQVGGYVPCKFPDWI
jgi:hypothetical protein